MRNGKFVKYILLSLLMFIPIYLYKFFGVHNMLQAWYHIFWQWCLIWTAVNIYNHFKNSSEEK